MHYKRLYFVGIKFANSSFELHAKKCGQHTFKCLHLGGLKLEISGTHLIPTRLFKGFKGENIVT